MSVLSYLFKFSPSVVKRVNARLLHFYSHSQCNVFPLTLCPFKLVPKIRVYSRFIHLTNVVRITFYKEYENELAHKILESSSAYCNTVVKHPSHLKEVDEKLEKVGINKLIKQFCDVTQENQKQKTLEDPEYWKLVNFLAIYLPKATDQELRLILSHLCMWPENDSVSAPCFQLLWYALDKECTSRLPRWTTEYKLLIADYFFHLRLSRISKYNTSMIYSLVANKENLTDFQLVQLMFYISVQRNVPQSVMNELEKQVESAVKSVTSEELGVIGLGYFKTKNRITNINILLSVIKRVISEIDKMPSVTSVGVLKFLKKSYSDHLFKYYSQLLEKCSTSVDKFNSKFAVHSVLLASVANIYNPSLFDKVANILVNDIDKAFIKDFYKFLQGCSRFNHMPPEQFNESLLEEITKTHRQNEIRKFPYILAYIALYYAYMNYYPLNLMKTIFNDKFIQHFCSVHGFNFLTPYAVLDYCIELECPDYDGPRASLKILKILQNHRGNVPSENSKGSVPVKMLNNIQDALLEILGSQHNVCIRHVLPHFYTPDIIVRLNSNKNSEPLHKIVEKCPPESILIPPKDESWACFVACGLFSYAYQSKQLCGLLAMKERQLSKLGYKVILIPYNELLTDIAQRKKYIQLKLESLETSSCDYLTIKQ